jgi:ABC-type molybdate transport system substrate-binding protein
MATKIRILSGGAMRPLLRELVPLFARTHDVTADIEFQLSAALKRAIQNGVVFDIAISLPAELQNVIIYAPGVSPRAPDAQAATHFLAFMRDAQAKQLMRAKGLDPA